MANVLLVAEHFEGKLKRATLSAVTAARALAKGGKITALVLGKGVSGPAAELAPYAAEVLAGDDARLEHPVADTWARAIEKAAKDSGAEWVVAAATAQSRDILPRVAARLSAGMASDVMSVNDDGSLRRPMWAGSVLADVEITTPVKVLTVRATEFPAAQPAGQGEVKPLALPELPASRARFVEFRQVKSARPELTEARIVVSGGRGTKGDFKPIDALADELGAAVGASRAVVDAGWVPNEYQVGQTGKTVAPDLYIALGISGAIQHIAGMKGSRVIVAINKDPEAPIFQIADYGLVGDLFKIAPELQAALKAARG
jgi:electron transfer flavoprotein alpha subunit